jgi:hypothetical protein
MVVKEGAMADEQHIIDIVASGIVREPFVSHSGVALPWKWEWERVDRTGLICLAEALDDLVGSQMAVAGIERGGWVFCVYMRRRPAVCVVRGHCHFEDHRRHWARPVVLVDDVLTTGRSMRAAEIILDGYSIPVAARLVVLDRSGAQCNPKAQSLVTTADLIAAGVEV